MWWTVCLGCSDGGAIVGGRKGCPIFPDPNHHFYMSCVIQPDMFCISPSWIIGKSFWTLRAGENNLQMEIADLLSFPDFNRAVILWDVRLFVRARFFRRVFSVKRGPLRRNTDHRSWIILQCFTKLTWSLPSESWDSEPNQMHVNMFFIT